MGGVSLLARQFGRRQDGLNTLAFTASLMTVFDPRLPWDVSFQLSFLTTLGMMLFADKLLEAFNRLASRRLSSAAVERLAGPVSEFFLLTLSAQVFTIPLMAYHFHHVSLVVC